MYSEPEQPGEKEESVTTKVLFINCSEENIASDTNKGSEAVIISTVELLSKLMPEATFASFLNCSKGLSRRLNLRVVRMKKISPFLPRFFGEVKSSLNFLNCFIWVGINKYLHVNWHFLINNTRLREYANADIIIHLGMDYCSDDAGTQTVLKHCRDIMLGILLKKPVVIWAESMGPFGRLSQPIAKFVLNRVSLITVRDSLSRAFLLEAGVNKPPLYFTSDPSFLLAPASKERIDEICSQEGVDVNNAEVIIGVNPSHSFIMLSANKEEANREKYIRTMSLLGSFLASLLPEKLFNPVLKIAEKSRLYSAVDSKYIEYKTFFAQLIDWLIEKYDATVLLIPHDQAMAQLFDDRLVAREIKELVYHKDRTILITEDHNAEAIKGIIGQCDLFIGARFHADIAALSQCIPTICFPYYHKFALISDLGQEKYICESYTLEETKAKVADAWKRRNEIEKELQSGLETIRKLSTLNGELVKKLSYGGNL